MNRQEVLIQVEKSLRKHLDIFGDVKITEETHLENDLGTDSLDHLELVILFENVFAIQIEDSKIGDLRRVGEIVDYISTCLGIIVNSDLTFTKKRFKTKHFKNEFHTCPYVEGMDMSKVAIRESDKREGHPKNGDLIAYQAYDTPDDLYLITSEYAKQLIDAE